MKAPGINASDANRKTKTLSN